MTGGKGYRAEFSRLDSVPAHASSAQHGLRSGALHIDGCRRSAGRCRADLEVQEATGVGGEREEMMEKAARLPWGSHLAAAMSSRLRTGQAALLTKLPGSGTTR